MKPSNRIVCCCICCENLILKLTTFNAVLRKHGKNKLTSTELANKSMCDKNEDEHHKNTCVNGTCKECGVEKMMKTYYGELFQFDDPVEYEEWMTINRTYQGRKTYQGRNGEQKQTTKPKRATKKATTQQFFNLFCTDLAKSIPHRFRADWQCEQFRNCVDELKVGEVVMVMDFSENYTCSLDSEIQSYHWGQQQVTLHPIMMY